MVEGLRIPAQLRPADNGAGRLLPHVLEATAHAQRLRAVPDRAVRLLTTAGNNLRDVGQLDTSRPVLDRALAIAQVQLGPDHPDTLTARANLARWLGEAGQPDQAAAQYRDLLTDYLRVLGPDHPDTLTTRANLARWLGEAGSRRLRQSRCGLAPPRSPKTGPRGQFQRQNRNSERPGGA